MKLTEFFRAQLDREVRGTRSALERVPEGRNDWTPHPKSMQLGYLASLVARMPSWIAMTIDTDEFNLDPQARSTSSFTPNVQNTTADLLKLLDASVAEAHEALARTTDDHLMKPWRFKVAGRVVSEDPRHVVISDSVLAHLAHHRGQLTVYLRLNDATVPAIYGPSADEQM
jgi:uncharacterized damage-inducible protein DinB